MNQKSSGQHGHSTLYIVGAILAAIVVAIAGPAMIGESFRPMLAVLDVGGEVFLRMLQMVVVPLVMASVMSGILGLGDVRRLGKPGGYAIAYYMSTTILAVITGLIVVNIVNPGRGIDKALVEDAREEGEETVTHVTGRNDMRKVEWHNVTGDRAASAGESKNVSVPNPGPWSVRLTIDQVGKATTPGSAQVQISSDGNTFQDLAAGRRVSPRPCIALQDPAQRRCFAQAH